MEFLQIPSIFTVWPSPSRKLEYHQCKGQPHWCVLWGLVSKWYKSFPPDLRFWSVRNGLDYKQYSALTHRPINVFLYRVMIKRILLNVATRCFKGKANKDWVGRKWMRHVTCVHEWAMSHVYMNESLQVYLKEPAIMNCVGRMKSIGLGAGGKRLGWPPVCAKESFDHGLHCVWQSLRLCQSIILVQQRDHPRLSPSAICSWSHCCEIVHVQRIFLEFIPSLMMTKATPSPGHSTR